MQVWVLRDNPAVHFYKKCGGKWSGEQELKIGEQIVIEDAYVWVDLEKRLDI